MSESVATIGATWLTDKRAGCRLLSGLARRARHLEDPFESRHNRLELRSRVRKVWLGGGGW
jgi:hypothetical protein